MSKVGFEPAPLVCQINEGQEGMIYNRTIDLIIRQARNIWNLNVDYSQRKKNGMPKLIGFIPLGAGMFE